MSETRSLPCRSSAFELREFVGRLPFAACRRVATGWRARALALALLSVLTLPGSVAADVVTDWTVVIETVAPRFGGPQQQSRVQTIAHVAIHDALNAIVPRYERYTDIGRADSTLLPTRRSRRRAGRPCWPSWRTSRTRR